MEEEQSMILIDTDILINLFDPYKSNHAIADKTLANLILAKTVLTVSIITEIEMIQGTKTNVEKKGLVKKLDVFKAINVTEEISDAAKQLIIQYSSSHGLMLADSFIAATALHFDIELFTFNKKDFRFIKNLKLYEPL